MDVMGRFIGVVGAYIRLRGEVVQCQQRHFRQVCGRCEEYAHCQLYGNYCAVWIEMQKVYQKVINLKE